MFPRHKRKKQRGVHQSAGSGCLLFGQGADSRQQQPVCAGKNSFLRSQPTEIANVKVCDKKSLVEHCNFSQFTYLEQCCLCNLSSPLNFAVCIYGHFVNESFFYVLQIFSNDGQFKSRFGVRGRTPGQLQRPTGVAVHPNGDIIIADYDNKWVSIFSSEGKFKVRWAVICLLSVCGRK